MGAPQRRQKRASARWPWTPQDGQASVLSSPFSFEISELTMPVGTAMIA
jgi:hypothetical protein